MKCAATAGSQIGLSPQPHFKTSIVAKPYLKLCSVNKFEKKRKEKKKMRVKLDHGSGASEAHPAQDGVAAERDSWIKMPT